MCNEAQTVGILNLVQDHSFRLRVLAVAHTTVSELAPLNIELAKPRIDLLESTDMRFAHTCALEVADMLLS